MSAKGRPAWRIWWTFDPALTTIRADGRCWTRDPELAKFCTAARMQGQRVQAETVKEPWGERLITASMVPS